MKENQTPFFHLDRYPSLPRPGPRPVPPHSGLNASPDATLHDCHGMNSEAQVSRRADGHSEHKGSGWLQGWLDDTLPGQAYKLGQGPFLEQLTVLSGRRRSGN